MNFLIKLIQKKLLSEIIEEISTHSTNYNILPISASHTFTILAPLSTNQTFIGQEYRELRAVILVIPWHLISHRGLVCCPTSSNSSSLRIPS